MQGQPVGLGLWKEAMAELVDAEQRLAATNLDDKIVVQSPDLTINDNVVVMLGTTFRLLEAFMVEMIKKGAFDSVRADIADHMLNVRKLLKQLHYEPIKHRKNEPMTFNVRNPPKKP